MLPLCNGLTLMSLPEWIGDLTSLQTLQILDCPNLISLPEGVHCLTSLRHLTIARCPRLEERVKKEWERIGQKLLTSPTFRISSTSTNHMEWIRSLMHQFFFRFLSHQLDSNLYSTNGSMKDWVKDL
jgi:hypothetical protein